MTCSCDIITNELLVAYALSMQSTVDQVHTLLCNQPVNPSTYSWDIIAIESLDCLPVWHRHSWAACTYSTLWVNNNWWLRSCFHNYPLSYCYYGIAIANEASAFNLTFMWTQFESVSLWRRDNILLTLLSLKQSDNQLHLNETINLTISQLVFSFSCYVWKQSNMMHEKDSTAVHCTCSQFL